eukprot:6203584-Pleurochrysis_carterae.AAC.2
MSSKGQWQPFTCFSLNALEAEFGCKYRQFSAHSAIPYGWLASFFLRDAEGRGLKRQLWKRAYVTGTFIACAAQQSKGLEGSSAMPQALARVLSCLMR